MSKFETKIELGKTYTDNVTGFSGVATSAVFYHTGCTHICLQPKVDKDGKIPDSIYFDESRLNPEIEKPGGPGDHPKPSSTQH